MTDELEPEPIDDYPAGHSDGESHRQIPSWVDDHMPAELANCPAFRFMITLPSPVAPGSSELAKVVVDVLRPLDIDYDQLEVLMAQHPAHYTFWATIYSEMRGRVSHIERQIKVRRGRITRRVLDEFRQAGLKPTGEQLKDIVNADDELDALEKRLAYQQKTVGKLWHMMEALKSKAELMRSLAGFRRQELADSGS